MFVGDLPPGCGHYELQELFSQLANVVNIKYLEHKSIAFVTVESDAEVGHIIDVADTSGLHIHGAIIRVARAHHPSDGQVLPQPLSPAQPTGTNQAQLSMQGPKGHNCIMYKRVPRHAKSTCRAGHLAACERTGQSGHR